MRTVLASASPRRRELLEMLGAKNLVVLPAKGEESPPEHTSPDRIVEALALSKAREVAQIWDEKEEHAEDDVIIAADTIVWHCSRVFGKPHSREDAFAMLRSLSGNTHEVYTGVAVLRNGQEVIGYERSAVTFRELSDREIWAYIDTGEPMDKAGAYGAQGIGALFVRGIEGDFFNVMGLPLCRLGEMLKQTGVQLL